LLTAVPALAPVGGHAAVPAWYADAVPDDRDMSAQVLARLAADEQTKALGIRVHSHDGVVRLNGVVDSEARAERAAALAHEVAGVWRVQNVLAVRAQEGSCAAGVREAMTGTHHD
jgi:hypothetical protein